jgi:hypothetical protein
MIFTLPPFSHVSISMRMAAPTKTRFNLCAHPNAARSRIAFAPAGLWGLLRFIVWFAWHDMRPQPAAGRKAAPRENTMEPGLGVPVSFTLGFGTQRSQAAHKLYGAENNVRGAVIVGSF